MKAKHLILAGTFDHFHLGHQEFIKNALNQADHAFCGVATKWDKKNKSFFQTIQSFKKRFKTLKKFLVQNRLFKKAAIFPLKNPFAPADSSSTIDTIAVTSETISGAIAVNQKRKIKGLKPLSILSVDLIKANDQKKISSTRIRLGEINRQGLVYQQILPHHQTLYLPQNQRQYFKKPMGKLIKGSKNNATWASLKAIQNLKLNRKQTPLIITVGDISTQAFLLNKIPIDLAIFDLRCQRKPINFNLHHQLKNQADFYRLVKNDPGTISSMSLNSFKKAIPQILVAKQKGIIQVKGEEDLLALPAVLLSPLKTLVFYGQPHQGLVQIKVTEKAKKKALNLLKKFSS